MKFKRLYLDESLFDDDFQSNIDVENNEPSNFDDYDDEFTEDELPEEDMQGPKSGSDSGITSLLIAAINDEWEAINAYNSLVETLRCESGNNSDYSAFIEVINEINSEENKHVGQLQELLQKLSPNAKYIDKGREEGKSQFNFADGKLQVQSWEQDNSSNPSLSVASGEELCSITNVDDEM